MTHYAALIEQARASCKYALRSGDMDLAWIIARKIVGYRILAGEIAVSLKRPKFLSPSMNANG